MADIRINALATTATTPASDDYLALDGTAQGTRKILATNIANNVTDVILGSSGPSVKSTLSARAPRQGLVFDGSAGATIGTFSNWGTADFSICAWIRPSLSANAYILTPTSGSDMYFTVNSNGTLRVSSGGFTQDLTSTGTVSANKWALVSYVRSGTTATFYINGIAAGSGTDSFNWGRVTGLGSSGYVGTIAPVYPYNRALSASEVVELYEAGAPAGADYNSASNTALNTNTVTDAGSGSLSGTSATGFTATATGAYYVRTAPVFSTIKGAKYRVTFTASSITGTWNSYLSLFNLAIDSTQYPVVSGANSFEMVANYTRTTNEVIEFASSGAGTLTVSGLSVTRIGLLLAPDAAQAGGGYVWNDQSGNLAQIVLPSSGVQWALPSVAGQRIRGTTSTNGNQQLLGASVLLPAECQITHVRARARSGTPTITIGTASGGAQIVASVALSTTWLNCTIALTGGIVSSADDIWVGSNSTDVVETDIAFQPLDF